MTKKQGVMQFADPPPAHRHQYDWPLIAEELREKPGDWALVWEKDRASLMTALRQGKIQVLSPGRGFEIRTANNTREAPRTCTLWMRYVPEQDTERNG